MEFLSVTDAFDYGLIPQDYKKIIPETCRFCGAPMVISDNLTQLKCGDPRCYRRIAGQIVNMLTDLGYKGYGVSTVFDYVYQYRLNSVIGFLINPPLALRNIVDILKEQQLTYPQLIRVMNIPRLKGRTEVIFKDINCYADYAKAVDDAGGLYNFLASRVGGAVLPAQLAEIMQIYDAELQLIEELVTPVQQQRSTIPIAITGAVLNVTDAGKHITKDAYIRILNDIVRPIGMAFKRSDALASVAFIVADTKSNTAKYRKGLERGNLITSDVLYNQCLSLVESRSKTEEFSHE